MIGFRVDTRGADDLRSELHHAAGRLVGPNGGTWADQLFDAAGDWRDASEPSQALLDVVLHANVDLADHLAELPALARRRYLRDVLGIPELASVPDRVPATFTADPRALPVTVPAGTPLKAGRATSGRPRIYATADTLSIVGATVGRVRSYHGNGSPARDRAGEWNERDQPFVPFDPAHPAARHELVLITDLLDFEGGSLDVMLNVGDGAQPGDLDGAIWRHTTPSGLRDVVAAVLTQSGLRITLDGSHGPCELDGRAVNGLVASLPDAPLQSRWLTARLNAATVQVVARSGLSPSAVFFNDGALDINREFTPFGPTPQRSDSFYLRCDEAFAKPLASLSIELAQLGDAGVVQLVSPISDYVAVVLKTVKESQVELIGQIAANYLGVTQVWKPLTPLVSWERRVAGGWESFAGRDGLNTINVSVSPSTAMSEPFELGGQTGHFVRAFLKGGDFGWSAFQRRLANVVAGVKVGANDLVPPEPPKLSGVKLSYTTAAVRVTEVLVLNGLDRAVISGSARPFFDDTAAGPLGRIDIDVTVPATALATTVSLYIGVVGAAACPRPLLGVEARWMAWRSDGAWIPLALVDGTKGLRQNGVVRFVAPLDWASDEAGMRRLRFETDSPTTAGTLTMIVPDAVEAVYQFGGDAASDTTPATPLLPGTITGVATAVSGVKKVTNPSPSQGGRGPEVDYLRRASGVLRHRNRAVQRWDYEQLVLGRFPEVAVVCCLPRFRPDGTHGVGAVGLVVVPRSSDYAPTPSVDLSERIVSELASCASLHAGVEVVCAAYEQIGVSARIRLRQGVAALTARSSIANELDAWLHPLRVGSAGIGRSLFLSTIVALLEAHSDVDRISHVAFVGRPGDEIVTVDPCRGLIASTGAHHFDLEEQL